MQDLFFGSTGEVRGDVFAGYGYETDIPNVTGDLEQLRRPFAFDPVEIPPIPATTALPIC